MLYIEDVVAFILSVLFVGTVVFFSAFFVKKQILSRDTVREVTHILMGSWGVLWFLFKTHLAATVLTVSITLFIIFAPKNFKETYSKGDEKHIGLIFYSLMFTIITLFFWKTRIGSLAIFSLAFSDGFAGLIGKKFGKHKIRILLSKERSVEGFVASYVAALFSWMLAWVIYGGSFNSFDMIIFAFLVSLIELLSPPHTDNIFIPALVIIYGLL